MQTSMLAYAYSIESMRSFGIILGLIVHWQAFGLNPQVSVTMTSVRSRPNGRGSASRAKCSAPKIATGTEKATVAFVAHETGILILAPSRN